MILHFLCVIICSFFSYVVMELYDCSLLKVMRNYGDEFSIRQKIDLSRQISNGLLHLHSNNVIHADLALR